ALPILLFAFPDRNPGFHLIDHEATCVERGTPMLGRTPHPDRELTELERADTVHAADVKNGEIAPRFREDARALLFRQRRIRLVVEATHGASVGPIRSEERRVGKDR